MKSLTLPAPPALQSALILSDVTNAPEREKQSLDKVEKLNDHSEPEVEKVQEVYGINLTSSTMRCDAGDGESITLLKESREKENNRY